MDPLKNAVEIGVPFVQKHFDSSNLLAVVNPSRCRERAAFDSSSAILAEKVRGQTNCLESLLLLGDKITFSQTRLELLASQAEVNRQDEPAVLGQLARVVRG